MGSVIKNREQVFDVRTLERNRTLGYFQEGEYEKWLQNLADATSNAEFLPAKIFFIEAAKEANELDVDSDV